MAAREAYSLYVERAGEGAVPPQMGPYHPYQERVGVTAVRAPALPAQSAVRGEASEGGRSPPPSFWPHPKTSAVMVRNQASAKMASAARVERGASAGLTPPEPGTSASCPPDGAYTPAIEIP